MFKSGDCLLWKEIFFELCMNKAVPNAANNVANAKGMLTGVGAFVNKNNQITFKLQVYEQIKIAAVRAWRECPSQGDLGLTSIHQRPDETSQDFVAAYYRPVRGLSTIQKLTN